MFFKKILNAASRGGHSWLPGRWVQETPDDRRRYAQTGGYTPERIDALLRAASNGDISGLCVASREIRSRNWDVLHALQTRTAALSGSGWHIEPGDETPAAKTAADALERELREAGETGDGTFADLVGWLQLAVVDPFAAAEIVWKPDGGIAGFRSIGAWHFTLRDGFTPKLITEDAPSGMDLPPDKVIIHRRGGENDPSTGGLIRCLAWLHVFQNYPIKDLLAFVERYGMPFVVAKVDQGTFEEERWTLRRLIRSFGPDGGGIINRSTELELLQAANTGGDVYFKLLDYTGQAITKVLLGQLASSSDATGMSNGDAQSSVRQDLLDSDARAMESTLRSGLIAPWLRFHYGPGVPAPRIHFSTERPEDIQGLASALSTLSAAGLEAADVEEISARMGVKLQRKPVQEQPSMFMRQGGLPLSAGTGIALSNGGVSLVTKQTLPDALGEWLGPIADAASDLDDDALTDAEFAAKLKRCGNLAFGDSGAFEALANADMEDAYETANHVRQRKQ